MEMKSEFLSLEIFDDPAFKAFWVEITTLQQSLSKVVIIIWTFVDFAGRLPRNLKKMATASHTVDGKKSQTTTWDI